VTRRLAHASSVLQHYFHRWKLQVNIHKTEAILFTRRRPTLPAPLLFQNIQIPWKPHICYLGLLLDHRLLFTRHLMNVTHKATGTLVKLFPLLAHDSTSSAQNKLTLYKLCIRSILTYAAPVCSSTSSQINPKRTPIPQLHTICNTLPIHEHIRHMTARFFDNSSNHTNPLIRDIGNYSLCDLHRQYKKYIHKRTKHILL